MRKNDFVRLIFMLLLLTSISTVDMSIFLLKSSTHENKKFNNIIETTLNFGNLYNNLHKSAWVSSGVPICTADGNHNFFQLCPDGNGGAIMVWEDYRIAYNIGDIYSQHVNSNGNVTWTVNGVAICTVSKNENDVQLCSDEQGGAIITWDDNRNGIYIIYAQHMNSTGNVTWTVNGVRICTASNIDSRLCSDGKGGAIIIWEDSRNGNWDIYAQHVNSTGNMTWMANGVPICTANNIQELPQICLDGQGGAIFAWEDKRSGTNYDIYAQHMNSTGNTTWMTDGVPICTANDDQVWYYNPTTLDHICSDGQEGAIITWYDYRNGTNNDIYAQHINRLEM